MFTPFYQHWLQEFDLVPLKETKITCASCTMVNPPQNETLRDPGPFSASLKCCSYIPFLPNFSLGKIATMSRFDLRAGAFSPLGFVDVSAGASSERSYAAVAEKRCPFLSKDKALCEIWEARPSVCASYHCVSSGGARGLKYWEKAESLGNLFEWTLAHEVLWSLGFSSDETETMAQAISSRDRDAISASWLEWRDREDELYARTFEIALSISGSDLRDSMGDAGESLIQELQCVTDYASR